MKCRCGHRIVHTNIGYMHDILFFPYESATKAQIDLAGKIEIYDSRFSDACPCGCCEVSLGDD